MNSERSLCVARLRVESHALDFSRKRISLSWGIPAGTNSLERVNLLLSKPKFPRQGSLQPWVPQGARRKSPPSFFFEAANINANFCPQA
jgi:hypothetical protein